MRHRSTIGLHGLAAAMLTGVLAACVPVTVNITFPQEQLDAAARKIEDHTAEAAPASAPAPAPKPAPPAGGGRNVEVSPRIDTRSPEVLKATESRRARRPALRELRSKGCIGESNQGFAAERPGEGCGADVAKLIQEENADRRVIYQSFMKENNIPASDSARVHSAFAKARQERVRSNEWLQNEEGQWVRKP